MKNMEVAKKSVFLALTSFVLSFSGSIADDVCVKTGPCTCEFSNGTGIDLSTATKPNFYLAQGYTVQKNGTQYELHTYYFHPCFDIDPKLNSTGENDTCGQSLSICRHVNTMVKVNVSESTFKMDKGVYNFMGTTNYTQFSSDGKSIIYANGPSSTAVLLICAQTDNMLQVYSLDEPKDVVLAFYSRDACLKLIETGRSFGSTLCIIFFSFVIFYLVLGVLTRKFLMGATGIEVVPNLAFWMDLPNLVQDGWAFLVNGFKLPSRGPGPVTSPDPNSYDSI